MASPVMLSPHLSSEALRLRYRQCKDPADRTRWQALWLLSQEQHTAFPSAPDSIFGNDEMGTLEQYELFSSR